MANPNPQHNPTDGLNTAAIITLTGTNVTALVVGHLYSVPLNVGASPNPATVALTALKRDVTNANTFTSGNSNVVIWKSYNTAQATVSAGTITAVAPGQAIIEAQFPTFDNTEGTDTATGNPRDMIYTQVIVTVGP